MHIWSHSLARHEIVAPVWSWEQITWRLLGGGMHVIVIHQNLTRNLAEGSQRTKGYLVDYFRRALETVWKHHRLKENNRFLIGQTFQRPAPTKGVEIKHSILVRKWEFRELGGASFTKIFDYYPTRASFLNSQILKQLQLHNAAEEFCICLLSCNLEKNIHYLAVAYKPVGAILVVFSFLRVPDSPVPNNKNNQF